MKTESTAKQLQLAGTIEQVKLELYHLGRIKDHAIQQAAKATDLLNRKTYAKKVGPAKVLRMQRRLASHNDTVRSVLAELNSLQSQLESLVSQHEGMVQ